MFWWKWSQKRSAWNYFRVKFCFDYEVVQIKIARWIICTNVMRVSKGGPDPPPLKKSNVFKWTLSNYKKICVSRPPTPSRKTKKKTAELPPEIFFLHPRMNVDNFNQTLFLKSLSLIHYVLHEKKVCHIADSEFPHDAST